MKIGKISTHGYSDQSMSDGHLLLPSGSTNNRPISANDGMLRYNTSTGSIEGYSRKYWSDFLTTAEFQIPGVEIDEDENVTIASLAILLSQFQRTITGGVDLRGDASTHDILHGTVEPLPSPLTNEFAYLSGSNAIEPPIRGVIEGYKDTAGKGANYLAVVGERIKYATMGAWNIGNYTSGMGGQTFQQIIDPYKLTGFPESERYNYLLEYFAGIYNVDWITSGYVVNGGDVTLTPAWNLLDPYNDPDYGKMLLTINNRQAAGVHASSSKMAQKQNVFAKWYVKFVKFRGFKLKSSPGFSPGGGSSPMPEDSSGNPTPPNIDVKTDYQGLIIKDYLMRKFPTWSPGPPVFATVHIQPDVALYSNTPGKPAIDCTGLPAGSVLSIKNEGYIIGGGGIGGNPAGWQVDQSTKTVKFFSAQAGSDGGVAILSDSNVTLQIDNGAGVVGGGGGGGGGGGARNIWGNSIVYAAGAGAGGGGAVGLRTSDMAFGQGVSFNTVGNTPEIKAKHWDSTGGTGGSVRTGSGLIQYAGGSSGLPGYFIIPELSGGAGGPGGDVGDFGIIGETVSEYPNISIIGWQLSAGGGPYIEANDFIEIAGNKITFVNTTAGSGEYQLDPTGSNNNQAWLQALVDTGVFDSADYDIHVFQDVTGESNGQFLDTTSIWRELVLGLILVSKSTGANAETWIQNFHSNGGKMISISPVGSSGTTSTGGAGGAPGNALLNAIKNYGVVDVTQTPAGFTSDSSKAGDIRGTVS